MNRLQLFTIFVYLRVLLEYATKLGVMPNAVLFAFTAVAGFAVLLANIRPIIFASTAEAGGALLIVSFLIFDCSRAFVTGNPEFIVASIYYSVLLLLVLVLASTDMIRIDAANLRMILYLFSFGSLFAALLDYPLGLARVFDDTAIARPSGLWVNPNVMSFVCFVTISATVALRAHAAIGRGVSIAVCAAAGAAMLLAFSLSGLAALLLFAGGMIVGSRRTSRTQVLILTAAGIGVALLVIPGFIANLEARILSFGTDANSLTYRMNMLLIAARLLSDPFFLAFGGGFWFEKSVLGEDLHNDYARLLVAGGLSLLLAFLAWILALVVRVTRWMLADRRYLPVWLALGISLGWGAVDSVYRTNPGSFLLFLICSPVLFRMYRPVKAIAA